MIAIFSDTHSTSGHELEGEALTAAREADAVIHAGDFTSTVALEAFQEECNRLYAVHGNADSGAVRDRLPTARVVVFGHSHRPTVIETEDTLLLNPGSHADPRGNRPGFAVLENRDDEANDGASGLVGEIREPDGTPIDSFELTGVSSESLR